VVQIRDQAAGEALVGQRLADHSRLAVMQRALGVEQVRHHPGAAVSRRGHLPRRRVAVAHADQDAGFGQPAGGG